MADNQQPEDQPGGDSDNGPRNGSEELQSDYGSLAVTSEFTTLNTSTMIHKYVNGRRYQSFLDDRYGLPNDDLEQNREHLKHRLYTDYVLDGNVFLSPIGDHPQKIVDLGAGAGFWPVEVGEKYPSAYVIGSDICGITPPWTPPNVVFKVEDLDDESQPWTRIYANADLVHFRSVIQAVRHPDLFLQRAYDILRPGGWIECHDIFIPLTWEDGTPATDHPLQEIYDLANNGEFARKLGWQVYYPRTLPDRLRRLGCINIQEKHTPVPIGRWARETRLREMGMINQDVIIDWAVAMLVRHDDLGITEEAAMRLCKRLLDDMDNPRIHARLDWGAVWAQKPESAPSVDES